jgi:DNA end-binding protein Ku
MTEDFEPEQYHDAYREALEAVVRAKIEGNDVVRPAGLAEPQPKGEIADLTETLRASVAALKAERSGSGSGGKDGKDDKDKPAPKRAASAKAPAKSRAKPAAKDDAKPAAARRKASA